jgi:hypothetical protein
MDISWGLRILTAGGRMAGLSLDFYPVNLAMKCQSVRGQNRAAAHSK